MAFKFDLVNNYGELEETNGAYKKLFTKISWNGKPACYDIRQFDVTTLDTNDIRMGKGISLSEEAIENLCKKILDLGFIEDDYLEDILYNRKNKFNPDKKKSKKMKFKIKMNR